MIIKKLLPLVVALLLLPAAVVAQECKYKTNTVDKFTKTKKIETEPVALCSSTKVEGNKIKKLGMILSVDNDKKMFTLGFTVAQGVGPLFVGNSGNKIVLLLDDGTSVELAMLGLMADRKGNDCWVHFELPDDKYQQLMAHNFTDVRMLPTMNPMDFAVDKEVKTSFYFNNCLK